jgi:DNA-binding PadR family transcriptional regulator
VTVVFKHGALRLYLLKLLDESPRHGYEIISLLEDRFLGLYAPSAGTIYPRLAKLEAEGLVEHDEADGRKTYRLTAAGRAELDRQSELLESLEAELSRSVAAMAKDVREQVRASVRDLRDELKQAAREVRRETRVHRRASNGYVADERLAELTQALDTLRTDVLAAARAVDADVRAAVDVVRRVTDDVVNALRSDEEPHP